MPAANSRASADLLYRNRRACFCFAKAGSVIPDQHHVSIQQVSSIDNITEWHLSRAGVRRRAQTGCENDRLLKPSQRVRAEPVCSEGTDSSS
jgi:hypothetical protein